MTDKPWLKFYGDVPESIDYPRVTMYEALMQTVSRNPDVVAYDFFGYAATYRQFGTEIEAVFGEEIRDLVARGLIERPPDRVRLTSHGRLLGNQVFAEFMPD